MPTSAELQSLARLLLDFRGRADRRAMGIATVALLLTQLLLATVFALFGALSSPLFIAVNLLLGWIGGTVILRRLHDIGYSGWWTLAAFAFWVVGAMLITLALMLAVGPQRFATALETYPILHTALVIALSLPPFGGLLWLQASPGMSGTNRFGVIPGAYGFAPGIRRGGDTGALADVAPASA